MDDVPPNWRFDRSAGQVPTAHLPHHIATANSLAERGRFKDALEAIDTTGVDSWAQEKLRAGCLAAISRYEESLNTLRRAAISDATVAPEAALERAALYLRMGQPYETLRSLSPVLELIKETDLLPRSLTVLADAYTQLADWQRAEDMCDAAIFSATQLFGHSLETNPIGYGLVADRKLAIARLAAQTGRHRRALYVLDGIEIQGVYGSKSPLVEKEHRAFLAARLETLMIEVDLLAGDSFLAIGDLVKSRDRYKRAIEFSAERGDTAIEIDALAGQGIVALRLGDRQEAIHCLHDAVTLADRWRQEFVSEDNRIGLRVRQAKLYDALVDVGVEVGDAAVAWQFCERSRAREFLSAIHRGYVRPLGTDPSVDLVANLSSEIQEISSMLNSMDSKVAGFGELRERREHLQNRKVLAVRDVRHRNQMADQALAPPILTVPEVTTVLGSDTALVQYHVTSQSIVAAVLTQEGISIVPIPGAPAALRRRVRRHLQLVSQPDAALATGESWREVGAHLHRWLWEPITTYIADYRRVCLIAHGLLQDLPFATIGVREPLMTIHEIVQVPSASVLAALGHGELSRINKVSVLANPLQTIPRYNLPAAEYEAAAIRSTTFDVNIRIGAKATVAEARKAAESADVLHLACHAEYDPNRPLLSALLLADDGGNNGRLEAHEIYTMPINASLIVLSACDTARSPESPGTELEGLIRSFMAAGAKAVIASQWLVQDAATARLMSDFYINLQRGSAPSTALHEAQLALAQESDFEHPYIWGAFSFYGRWW